MILGLQPRTPREGRRHDERPSTARELWDRKGTAGNYSPRQKRAGLYNRETAVKRSSRVSAAGILEHGLAHRPQAPRRMQRRAFETDAKLGSLVVNDETARDSESAVDSAMRLARVAREQLVAAANEEQRIRSRLADAGDQLWRAQLRLDQLRLPRRTGARLPIPPPQSRRAGRPKRFVKRLRQSTSAASDMVQQAEANMSSESSLKMEGSEHGEGEGGREEREAWDAGRAEVKDDDEEEDEEDEEEMEMARVGRSERVEYIGAMNRARSGGRGGSRRRKKKEEGRLGALMRERDREREREHERQRADDLLTMRLLYMALEACSAVEPVTASALAGTTHARRAAEVAQVLPGAEVESLQRLDERVLVVMEAALRLKTRYARVMRGPMHGGAHSVRETYRTQMEALERENERLKERLRERTADATDMLSESQLMADGDREGGRELVGEEAGHVMVTPVRGAGDRSRGRDLSGRGRDLSGRGRDLVDTPQRGLDGERSVDELDGPLLEGEERMAAGSRTGRPGSGGWRGEWREEEGGGRKERSEVEERSEGGREGGRAPSGESEEGEVSAASTRASGGGSQRGGEAGRIVEGGEGWESGGGFDRAGEERKKREDQQEAEREREKAREQARKWEAEREKMREELAALRAEVRGERERLAAERAEGGVASHDGQQKPRTEQASANPDAVQQKATAAHAAMEPAPATRPEHGSGKDGAEQERQGEQEAEVALEREEKREEGGRGGEAESGAAVQEEQRKGEDAAARAEREAALRAAEAVREELGRVLEAKAALEAKATQAEQQLQSQMETARMEAESAKAEAEKAKMEAEQAKKEVEAVRLEAAALAAKHEEEAQGEEVSSRAKTEEVMEELESVKAQLEATDERVKAKEEALLAAHKGVEEREGRLQETEAALLEAQDKVKEMETKLESAQSASSLANDRVLEKLRNANARAEKAEQDAEKATDAVEHQMKLAMMERDGKAESERRRLEADLVVLCNNYGSSLKKEQKLDQAAVMFQRALQLQTRLSGEEALDLAPILINLGATHMALNQRPAALPLFQRAQRIRSATLGADHKQTVAASKWVAKCEGGSDPAGSSRSLLSFGSSPGASPVGGVARRSASAAAQLNGGERGGELEASEGGKGRDQGKRVGFEGVPELPEMEAREGGGEALIASAAAAAAEAAEPRSKQDEEAAAREEVGEASCEEGGRDGAGQGESEGGGQGEMEARGEDGIEGGEQGAGGGEQVQAPAEGKEDEGGERAAEEDDVQREADDAGGKGTGAEDETEVRKVEDGEQARGEEKEDAEDEKQVGSGQGFGKPNWSSGDSSSSESEESDEDG